MPEPLVVSLMALPAGIISLLAASRALATRGLEAQIQMLEGQVVAWQSMHDHQVASMDRRLLDLEECAARAEEESRLVSLQMQRINQALQHRVDPSNRHDDGHIHRHAQDVRGAALVGGGW